jgi:hypothetical protein
LFCCLRIELSTVNCGLKILGGKFQKISLKFEITFVTGHC